LDELRAYRSLVIARKSARQPLAQARQTALLRTCVLGSQPDLAGSSSPYSLKPNPLTPTYKGTLLSRDYYTASLGVQYVYTLVSRHYYTASLAVQYVGMYK